jgi:hypothetical protein
VAATAGPQGTGRCRRGGASPGRAGGGNLAGRAREAWPRPPAQGRLAIPLFPLTDTGRAGALQAAKEAGYRLRLLSGRWHVEAFTAGEAEACQALIVGFDDLAAAKREKRRAIERELQRRLTQNLSLARAITIGGAGIKLLAQNSSLPVAEWPEADRNLILSLVAQFERANGILMAALGLESAVDGADLTAVRALDVTNDELWPE